MLQLLLLLLLLLLLQLLLLLLQLLLDKLHLRIRCQHSVRQRLPLQQPGAQAVDVGALVVEQLLDLSGGGSKQTLQRRTLPDEKVAFLHEKPQLCIQLLFCGVCVVLPQEVNGLLPLAGDACARARHAAKNLCLLRHSLA